MAQGTIKSLLEDKGFGFIKPDEGGKDIFFHNSVVEDVSFYQLNQGQRVEFTAGPDSRDPSRIRAERVSPVAE
jgi:CspA family cold shock protein